MVFFKELRIGGVHPSNRAKVHKQCCSGDKTVETCVGFNRLGNQTLSVASEDIYASANQCPLNDFAKTPKSSFQKDPRQQQQEKKTDTKLCI